MKFSSSSLDFTRAVLAMLDVRLTDVTRGGPALEGRELEAMLSDVRTLREELNGTHEE